MSENAIEIDQEEDGRWIAEAVDFPGVMAYGKTQQEAIDSVKKILNDLDEQEISRFVGELQSRQKKAIAYGVLIGTTVVGLLFVWWYVTSFLVRISFTP